MNYSQSFIEQFETVLNQCKTDGFEIVINESVNAADIVKFIQSVYYATQNQQLKTLLMELIKATVRLQSLGGGFDATIARRLAMMG
jgi:iron-sulfur cluster repair protein YtfE (RIC family)